MSDVAVTSAFVTREGQSAPARQKIHALPPGDTGLLPTMTFGTQPHNVKYVFIHGALSSPAIWTPLCAGSPAFNAAAFPLPGHHPWSVTPEETQQLLREEAFLDHYRDWILRFADAPVHLVAHSTGALAALLFAGRHPDLVKHLTLMGSFADGRKAVEAGMAGRAVTMPVIGKPLFESCCRLWLSSDARFDSGVSTVMSARGARADAATAETLRHMHADLRRCAPQSLWQVILWLKDHSLETALADIHTPCTLVVGQGDPVVETAKQMTILQGLPNCVALLTDLGHLPMLERPAYLRRLLEDTMAKQAER